MTKTMSAVAIAATLILPVAATAAPQPAARKAAPAKPTPTKSTPTKPIPAKPIKPTIVSMKQLTVTVDPGGDAKVNGDKVAAFQSATLGIFSCGDVEDVARSVGASVTDAPDVPLTALPPSLRETVGTMKVGTATQMFGDRANGKVRVLVLCARR